MVRTSNLGLVVPDSGFYSGTPPVPNTYHYNNGYWTKYWTTTEFPASSCNFWIPFMLGYVGIGLAAANNAVYYIFSDGGEFHWNDAVSQINLVKPCAARVSTTQPMARC